MRACVHVCAQLFRSAAYQCVREPENQAAARRGEKIRFSERERKKSPVRGAAVHTRNHDSPASCRFRERERERERERKREGGGGGEKEREHLH